MLLIRDTFSDLFRPPSFTQVSCCPTLLWNVDIFDTRKYLRWENWRRPVRKPIYIPCIALIGDELDLS